MVLTRIFIPGTLLVLCLVVTLPLWAPEPPPSIATDGNIETDAQLVSNVATGTAPLVVSSTTKVSNLNAAFLDDYGPGSFALHSEHLAAIDALDNPDPPCFDTSYRFVDCSNGTVTDTVTGLIWLYDANCFGTQNWPTANESAAGLEDGECGLTDGSRPGDWRLPTKEEWEGILKSDCPDLDPDIEIVGNGSPTSGCYSDSASSDWATGVESAYYWSSTTYSTITTFTWGANLVVGGPLNGPKAGGGYVWPVRGGQ